MSATAPVRVNPFKNLSDEFVAEPWDKPTDHEFRFRMVLALEKGKPFRGEDGRFIPIALWKCCVKCGLEQNEYVESFQLPLPSGPCGGRE